MRDSSIIGTRIRERRLQQGMRQAELAKLAGISPSYLNLIEHNRRRIGGKILIRLAEILEVESTLLAEGAEVALVAILNETAGGLPGAEEFAGRFTGWARVLADKHQRVGVLERNLRILTDRLAHDPQLAVALHEVIDAVTAVRATASILVDTKELEPEWQARFHRNLNEDSGRLAEGAEHLVRYLEAVPDTQAGIRTPQDELHAFLAEHGYCFAGLEQAGEAGIDGIIAASDRLNSDVGARLAREFLLQYLRDARRLPMQRLLDGVARCGIAPDMLSGALNTDLACVFRRLATLPENVAGPVGLVICDGAGALVLRKPLAEFDLPRVSAGCAQWPLYQVLAQPQGPVHMHLRQAGPGGLPVEVFAVAEQVQPASFSQPALIRAHMLLVPGADPTRAAREVGTTCRTCPLPECPARREPSITGQGF
ncbi:Transcriptional regulator [hydrothermal vent metagenome]|uniref:Transcriptional regulator n=1 Tax=hydrothermal vent metagenome TaxID=652676 RepID=A0A3B0SI35_9ZZZZ